MADPKKKASSLADNPPIELYGPEDGGWYSTRVHDWIGLCVDLRDPDVRGYLVLRSLVIEKYKNPVRKLTLLDLCELIPSPTKGQPSSLTRVRGILEALSGVGLVSTPEGGPVKTSSRPSAASKTIRIRVNDLPQDGYSGWRNTEDKLSHIQQHRATAPCDDAGRKSDPDPDGNSAGQEAGRKCDPAGRKSDPGGLKSDPEPPDDQEEREVPLVPTLGMGSGGDALSARSAVDVRRTSSPGSSAREAEGGSAASGNDAPSPTPEEPQPPARTKTSSKAQHTRGQLDVVRTVRALYPPDLLAAPLPDVPFLSQAILDALAGDVPAADRTVEQLGKRIEQRWNHHGWASKFYAGQIDSLVGAAVAMVRPLKATDRYGCGNPRCEAGKGIDTGVDCHVCPERIAARKRARAAAPATPSAAPAPVPHQVAGGRIHRECSCGDPIAKDSNDELCRKCRRAAVRASSLVGAQGPAPF
jgi:hypothetical protein